ncbi:Sugar or nucleoside kinase, ribokinase family [Cohaesibacter marisflavi]|uniref:Sugar or nucleoside kinase, ribokinase family n=1 Tax=Cohaesibacter marisflavi TaxID=655353 RepID=A0A1I5I536_9HYPH|nr:carbohydrate kinase family protein [Cohaesibacter marisflavi]SFO55758.1 Sugar or nucleoside kinase, ribokinase family [Cohaesibacter marisflavi]
MKKKSLALATVGNVNVDLIMGPVSPNLPSGTELIVEHDELRVGGAAGNVALAWQALGCPYQIAANIGSDHFGDWLKAEFGAPAAGWPAASGNTTVSVGATHPDGERTFLTTKGHLLALSWPQVKQMIDWQVLSGGVLLVCGSFLTDSLTKDYPLMFAHARQHDVAIALDTGWPLEDWTDAIRAETLKWLANCQYILFNEIEATSLSGQDDPESAGRWLLDHMPDGGTVIIKRGGNGAMLVRADGILSCPAPKVALVDTIGAGDVFNAAFFAARAQGKDWPEAVQAAIETASLAISTHPRCYLPNTKPESFHELA